MNRLAPCTGIPSFASLSSSDSPEVALYTINGVNNVNTIDRLTASTAATLFSSISLSSLSSPSSCNSLLLSGSGSSVASETGSGSGSDTGSGSVLAVGSVEVGSDTADATVDSEVVVDTGSVAVPVSVVVGSELMSILHLDIIIFPTNNIYQTTNYDSQNLMQWTRSQILNAVKSLIVCFVLYSLTTAFSIYVFIIYKGFYLVHFGNGITVIFMNNIYPLHIRHLFPIISFAAYASVRYFSQTWTHIGIAGGANIIEQFILHEILHRTLRVHDLRVYNSFHFIQVMYGISVLVSFFMALIGTTCLHFASAVPFRRVLVTYFFSHLTGTFMVLYTYYVGRALWRRIPPKSVVFDLAVVITLDILLNAFTHYGVFRESAVIAMFPLLAYVSARTDQGWSLVAEIIVIVITFVSVIVGRGPFVDRAQSDLSVVISLYIVLVASAVMTSLLSFFMEQRRTALSTVTSLKDEMFLVSSQVGHDVRAPIAHILDVCESMTTGDYTISDLEEVKDSCSSVTEMMETWLVMLRASSNGQISSDAVLKSQIVPVDMVSFMDRLVRQGQRIVTNSSKQILFHIDYPEPDCRFLEFNSKLFNHVMNNLVSNAVKYSEQGQITIGSIVTNTSDTFSLTLSVADEGNGIAPENLKNLFEQFYRINQQTQTDGSPVSYGLGLCIVDTLVKKMQGTIDVKSTVGRGSIFTVTVPCKQSDSTSFLTEETVHLENTSVVIVDDNRVCARLYAKHLNGCKELRIISDGALVMDAIRENLFEVVLLDNTLPNRTGKQILTELMHESTTLRLVPVIVTISGGDALMVPGNWKPLIVQHCIKPFAKQQLLKQIGIALRRKTRESFIMNV